MLLCQIESELAGHPRLREQKGLVGLPSVAFLDAAGTVLVQVPFDHRTVDGFRASGARAHRYVRLRERADTDPAAAAGFLLMQLEERQLSLDAARARRASIAELDAADLAARIAARIVDLEVAAALDAARTAGDARATLGPRFLAMHRDGPHPSPYVSRGFWFAMLEWAEARRDPAVFEEALAGMRASLATTDPDATWVPRLLADQEAKLRALRDRDG
ncbi:MAG: hypothetical protein IPM29_12915 [Planctomycetes bacterium]|nr:hypothetical protein [Planctomycetota bacterium]